MPVEYEFLVRGLLANRHLQTLLSSSKYRRRKLQAKAAGLLSVSQKWILDGGNGVRLLAYYSPQKAPKALAVLLHGWEGNSESNYVMATAATLFNAGFDVVRLNFRDHGDSHHLNDGLFHSLLIDEVVSAIADASNRIPARPIFLAGFSLGGNFALRSALKAPASNIPLQHVIAVSPVIRPHDVLDALESGLPIYEYYFNRKWENSLRQKQSLYPHLYDFKDWYNERRIRARTEALVLSHTPCTTLEEYLAGYSLAGEGLSGLQVPTTIVAAADDPVIPVKEIKNLPETKYLQRVYTEHGGHCAFLLNWKMDSWIEKFILQRFELALQEMETKDE